MITIKRLIEDELFIVCPPIPAGNFISYCKERGVPVSKNDLELYEKLGIFYPIARVELPKYRKKVEYNNDRTKCRDLGILQDDDDWRGEIEEEYGCFWWGKEIASDFYQEGRLWSPKEKPFTAWEDFHDKELEWTKIESYYSIFQIFPLHGIRQMLSLNISLAEWPTVDNDAIIKFIKQAGSYSKQVIDVLRKPNNFANTISLVSQAISNRYYPKTQTDRRLIRINRTDVYHDWSWYAYRRKWNPKTELQKLGINDTKIKECQRMMSSAACDCDPLENWYDLVRFISIEKKQRLKGSALLAQTFYAMEMMLRMFYKDLTGIGLSEDCGLEPKWKERVYGKGIPDLNMDFLEYLTNEFHLNPRPRMILVVEGKSEYEQIPRLAEAIRTSFDILGIRIELLEGIGGAKPEKLEKFIDHYHSLQTIVFLILDNDARAESFKTKLLKAKSRYKESNRFITKDDYVFLWNTCFEFDNFTDAEIAHALSTMYQKCTFSEDEIAVCRNDFGKRKGKDIDELVKGKSNLTLNKPLLAKQLVDNIIKDMDEEFVEGKPKRKLISKILEICDLASRNYQTHSYKLWKKNQESGHLGTKIEKDSK